MKKLVFLSLLLSSAILSQDETIILSEIMFYPEAGNNEFIELYNTSHDPVDLSRYKIKYYSSPPDSLISTGKGNLLQPESYAIILEGDYDFSDGIYKNKIPPEALVLRIDDNAFGSSGMSNSTSRGIYLLDGWKDTVDSYWYSANNNIGISDEKIKLSSGNQNNWKNSLYKGGSPGFRNSVALLNYDLAISSIHFNPEFHTAADSINLFAAIQNRGLLQSNEFRLEILIDLNGDTVWTEEEKFFSEDFAPIPNGDSLTAEIKIGRFPVGLYKFHLRIIYPEDEDTLNNIYNGLLRINPAPADYNDLIINEIMYAPPSGEPEWIEIYNRSASTINLKGWKVSDYTSKAVISTGDYEISPGEYLVVTRDSSLKQKYSGINNLLVMNLPSLNNSGDMSAIYDGSGRCIDSLEYLPVWGGNSAGKSLERISSEEFSVTQSNWGSAKEPTPGKVNSLCPKQYDLAVIRFSLSAPFVIYGTPIVISACIKNTGISISSSYQIKISAKQIGEDHFAVLKTFWLDPLPSGDSTLINFSYSDHSPDINYMSVRIYYEGDEHEANNYADTSFKSVIINELRNDIVINEIMYAPVNQEPEWIELFNRSDKTINIKNYKLADKNDTVRIADHSLMLQPLEYLIISKDSSLISYYEIDSECLTAKFPSLNNTGDRLILIDSLNRIIDSLEYSSSWGGSGGRSLERKNSDKTSVLQENWGSSRSEPSPGRRNSIAELNFNVGISSFNNLPYFEEGKTPDFEIRIYNSGIISITNGRIDVFLLRQDSLLSLEDELILSFNLQNVNPGDTITHTFQLPDLLPGLHYLAVRLSCDSDEDFSDNTAFSRIQCIRPEVFLHDLVISEIMYAPISPEPEWIELYNRSTNPIKLDGFSIKDNSSSARIRQKGIIINAGEFVIIAKDSSFFSIHETNVDVIVTAFPALNNSSDKITLIDSLKRTIDSVSYSSFWGGKNGKSLERVDYDNFISDSLNWKESDSGSTPGKINSVSWKKFNLSITRVIHSPEYPLSEDKVNLSVTVSNIGREETGFELLVFEDTDLDSTADALIRNISASELKPGDSTVITVDVIHQLKTVKAYALLIRSPNTEDSSDNYFYIRISPFSKSGRIVINEIMYAPQNGEPEWIELYNAFGKNINLRNWIVSDVFSTPLICVISKDHFIQPGEYVILTRDTAFSQYHKVDQDKLVFLNLPVLNNTEEGIVIKDFEGTTADSVLFTTRWGGQNGTSLERISHDSVNQKSNWGSSVSVEGSTPGSINSISPKKYDLQIVSFEHSPENPLSGEEVLLKLLIRNIGTLKAENFNIRFLYKTDSEMDYIIHSNNNYASLDSGDSLLLSAPALRIDSLLYTRTEILYDIDQDTSNNKLYHLLRAGSKTGSVVINEFMTEPKDNQPEWIEIYNCSDEDVSLRDWFLETSSANSRKLSDKNIMIRSQRYAVLINNSTSVPPVPSDVPVIVTSFTLSNTKGRIILKDFSGVVMDSVAYSIKNKKGFSLERKNYTADSNDSLNWLFSVDHTGGTPGRANSAGELASYSKGTIVINEIMYDPDENHCEFIELFNRGKQEVDIAGWMLFESSGYNHSISDTHFILYPGEYFLLSADSSILQTFPEVREKKLRIAGHELGLNYDKDMALLKDANFNTIDSVLYTSKFHNKYIPVTKNRSLERINPDLNSTIDDNWSTSVNPKGATPCLPNSINTSNEKANEKLSVSPNPFSPDNDGFEDFTILNYSFDEPVTLVRLKIFDSQGRLLRTIIDNMVSGSSGSIIFDGMNEDGVPLRIGIYIIFIEAVTQFNDTLTSRTVVVVARKL